MVNDKHCFECYGYDLLLDDDLKPWLVEVNASPSLAATTAMDREMKGALIRDVLAVAVPEELGEGEYRGANTRGPCRDTGDFVVLYDEAAEAEKVRRAEEERAMGKEKRKGKSWK